MELIKETCRQVERWLDASVNPVVLWSGGKDSTAMLHLIRYEVGAKLPVIQWREPRFRSRYAFSDRLANAWDLEMYDYAPLDYMLTDGFDIETGAPRFDFVKLYQFGQKALALCLGTEEPKPDELASGRYLCGLDALRRPTGTFEFPWDSAFHGQKSGDVDLIKGQVPLAQDALVQAGVPTQYYPMRHWSDADVWAYLEAAGVPNDDTRYEKADGVWQHRKDKSANSDYYPVCWNCVNRHLGDTVWCPKNSCETNNISHLAPYVDLTSEAQGFRPTWSDTTVRGVAHAALTSGPGQSYDETEAMLSASRNGCCATTTH
jgi:hypothetical protein